MRLPIALAGYMILSRHMKEPQYLVVVFGNPDLDGNPVDSGIYEAGDGYPPFSADSGDVLLLYCTEGYGPYQKEIPGFGIVLKADQRRIDYRWIPFAQAITNIDFEDNDSEKMRLLHMKVHRVFKISKQSFVRTVGNAAIAWEKLSE